jgi:hypothetical protein
MGDFYSSGWFQSPQGLMAVRQTQMCQSLLQNVGLTITERTSFHETVKCPESPFDSDWGFCQRFFGDA